MMQWLLVVGLLVLSSAPAYGEWILVDRDDELGMTLYVDPETIRRRGDLVNVWALYDYKDPQTRKSGDFYLSRKVQRDFNCYEKTKRLLGWEEFSGHMGNGKVVDKQSYLFSTEKPRWMPVISVDGGESLFNSVCKND